MPDSVNTRPVTVRQVIRTHVDSDSRKGGATLSIAGVPVACPDTTPAGHRVRAGLFP